MSEMNSLEEIAQLVSGCQDCALSGGRKQAVPGEGPSDAQIMFIGEGPGYHEDQQGRPFVGPAGRFLEELLHSIGLRREDVFIANMVKCRPTNNRDPMPNEISSCSKYLDRQIELIDPNIVVTLGRFSMSKFLPKDSISRAHGKMRKVGGLNVYPIMHPAAALHKQELKRVIEEDFKAIPNLVKEATNTESKNLDIEDPEQLTLF